jgi:hypothetical protein
VSQRYTTPRLSLFSHLFFSQHWCMGIAYIYTAFILHGDTPHGATMVFGGLSMSEVARFFVAGIITALLDGALVCVFGRAVWARAETSVGVPHVHRLGSQLAAGGSALLLHRGIHGIYRGTLPRIPLRLKDAVKPPQILLHTCIQVSRALSNPSLFIEAVLKAKTLKDQIIIAFSLSLVANSFCTGEFSPL